MIIITEKNQNFEKMKDSLCYTTKRFHIVFIIFNVFLLIYIPFQILVFGTPFQDTTQPGFPWGISFIFLLFCIAGLYSSFSKRKKLRRNEKLTKNLIKMHKFNVFANLLFIIYLITITISYYTVIITIFNEISGFYLFMVLTTLFSLFIGIIHFWIKSEDCDK